MEQIEQHQSVIVDHKNREVHFTIGGLWDLESMRQFLWGMDAKAAPMVGLGEGFSGLGNMRGMVAQTREVAECMGKHLMAAQAAGLKKVAIVEPPALVKSQYRRLAKDVNVAFFDNKMDAVAWLRS